MMNFYSTIDLHSKPNAGLKSNNVYMSMQNLNNSPLNEKYFKALSPLTQCENEIYEGIEETKQIINDHPIMDKNSKHMSKLYKLEKESVELMDENVQLKNSLNIINLEMLEEKKQLSEMVRIKIIENCRVIF